MKFNYLFCILFLFPLLIKKYVNRKCGIEFLQAKKSYTTPIGDNDNRYLQSSEYKPLRVHLDYSFIENNMSSFDKEDLIDLRDKIMPKTKEIWEKMLKVKRLETKLKFDTDKCDSFTIPEKYTRSGEGVDADIVIFVMIDDTGFFLENSIEAAAIHCLQHAITRRPIAGYIQFKPQIKANNSTAVDYNVWLAEHETTHILVMNEPLYEDFIDENGNVRGIENVIETRELISKRKVIKNKTSDLVFKFKDISENININDNEVGNTIQKKNLKQNFSLNNKLANRKGALNMNDINLEKEESVYNNKKSVNNVKFHLPKRMSTTSEKKINYIKTPKVLKIAKEHYNCDSIPGVPLEYNGGPGTAGAHWSKRYMNSDYMIGDSYCENLFSPMTLALFEDSGWYKVDYNLANLYLWGKNAGCDFFNNDCVANKESSIVSQFKEFCTKINEKMPSFHNISRGICAYKKYKNDLPENERHFTDSRLGGVDPLTDKCPIVIEERRGQSYYGGSCRVGVLFYSFEKICPECAAFTTTLIDPLKDKVNNSDEFENSFHSENTKIKAACFQFKCLNNRKILVYVKDKSYECSDNNKIINSIEGYEGDITCPSYDIICDRKFLCKNGCVDSYSNSNQKK